MKTPDEIKKGLEACGSDECHGHHTDCPYEDDLLCTMHICGDARAYIHQLENHIGELTEKVALLEAAQPKWISVEERLPDEPGEVLACVYGRICIAWYSNRCFETPSGMVFYACENAVTHWMPLPEPPKEDA